MQAQTTLLPYNDASLSKFVSAIGQRHIYAPTRHFHHHPGAGAVTRHLFSDAMFIPSPLFRCHFLCKAMAAFSLFAWSIDSAYGQTNLAPVVVTATRSNSLAFDVPASINAVSVHDPAMNTMGINPSEYLNTVPGLLARDRLNYAQDEQISIRGFGARSTFGVRGVRLYIDGLPATFPDGQGQVSNFSLGSADRIEVLRGPFSALYGNSSGGVIQLFTADGHGPPEWRVGVDGGSYGMYHLDANARGAAGALSYNVDASQFHTDNYRGHGRAERENGHGKFTYDLGGGRHLTLIANTVAVPNADDPMGLTRAQLDTNPRQPQPAAVLFDTRKSVHQQLGGAIYEQPLGDEQTLRILGYYGDRSVQQFQSIPIATQLNPASSGGVIDLDGNFYGSDVRWSYHGLLAGKSLDLTAGLSYDRQNQHRLGFNNFVGNTLGVLGALRRDEQDDEFNFDEYAQASWNVAARWLLSGGIRHSDVALSALDNHVTPISPNYSGRVNYSATSPVAGLLFRASDNWHLYASYGSGFETPTFNELGYRPNGSAGLNFALVPARSRNAEVGSKLKLNDHGGEFDLALFQADTRHELAVDTSIGGRTTYQNIDRAQRQGVEASLDWPVTNLWRMQIAYTWLDATFRMPFLTCPAATTCSKPNTLVPAGARIPGVPQSDFYAVLRYGDALGWNASLEASAASHIAVNDQNTQFAPGYAVMNASMGRGFTLRNAQIHTFLRLNNLLGKHYAGSIIVNESNGRYFEPADGRTIYAGVQLRWKYR